MFKKLLTICRLSRENSLEEQRKITETNYWTDGKKEVNYSSLRTAQDVLEAENQPEETADNLSEKKDKNSNGNYGGCYGCGGCGGGCAGGCGCGGCF